MRPITVPRGISEPAGESLELHDQLPSWSVWCPSVEYTLGVEEETMILHGSSWALARDTEDFLRSLPGELGMHVSAETHAAAIEIATAPHPDVAAVADELRILRAGLKRELCGQALQAASAGTHPLAMWTDTRVSPGARYQLIYESMRELARREPTFALHVHVGVPDSGDATALLNRFRAHLPLLLALSANSPFWQGRDTGLDSARTPIFQAFPRVGIPRRFSSYTEYVGVVDQLLRCQAFPEPSFLWWDVRLRPMFGTVEVRVMDSQGTTDRSAALAALVQAIAHLELEEGFHDERLIRASELLAENRFLAARDGMRAHLLDPVLEHRVPARQQLAQLMDALRPHAQELGSEAALDAVLEIAERTGAEQQREIAAGAGLPGVLAHLTETFSPG